MADQLVEAERVRRTMLTDIAHEPRTPPSRTLAQAEAGRLRLDIEACDVAAELRSLVSDAIEARIANATPNARPHMLIHSGDQIYVG